MTTQRPHDDDEYNPALDQVRELQPHIISQGSARDILLVGRYVYIVPVIGDNAGNWSQESPYRVVAIDEHGIWLQSQMRLRLNDEPTRPIRLMRWPSADYYAFDLIED